MKEFVTQHSAATNERFEQFHRAFESVSRTSSTPQEGPLLRAAWVYELAYFPEYKEMSRPIVKYNKKKLKNLSTDEVDVLKTALDHAATILK